MNLLAETNAAAQHMVNDWRTIDPDELHPDALRELRALAFEIRQTVEDQWKIRDDG